MTSLELGRCRICRREDVPVMADVAIEEPQRLILKLAIHSRPQSDLALFLGLAPRQCPGSGSVVGVRA